MAMLTETASRKRVYSPSERNPTWVSSPFTHLTPFGLANGSEINSPFEKRLRTTKKSTSTFKWEPENSGNLQYSAGYGFPNYEVKTPLPPAWQDRPTRGLSTPPYVRHSREMYEGVKEEMIRQQSWYGKLDQSTALAEGALDRVGRPVVGLNLTVGFSESYYQKFVNAKRELEDYKRVVKAVNSCFPLTSNGTLATFSSLERMRRRGSKLQQGPKNLYSIQETSRQRGGGRSNSRMSIGDPFMRNVYDELPATDASTSSDPGSSIQPAAATLNSNDNDDEAHLSKENVEQKKDWQISLEKIFPPAEVSRMQSHEKEIEAVTALYSRMKLHREEDGARRQKEREASKKEEVIEGLIPLSHEAEQAVENALYNGNSNEVLSFNEETNIEVTRAIMQCLVPNAWLNDEVINVYMQLLKERENRSPDKFLKCHFFNTFFYNKLFKDKRSYDYKAVRRWTTQKKIGYSLADCDKILIPIHQDIHWCLAVINLRDQKLEYLDSLNGRDENVLKVLARYIVDEAKDKNNRVLDVSKWDSVFPRDIPEQLNGCDCGMFMLKYADFHSRGESLPFTQEHMEYFRLRTVYEILFNKAS